LRTVPSNRHRSRNVRNLGDYRSIRIPCKRNWVYLQHVDSLQNAAWIESKLLANLLYELGPEILVAMHRHWGLAPSEPDKDVPSLATPLDDLDPGLAEITDQFLAPSPTQC